MNTIDFGAQFDLRVSYVFDETKFLVTMDHDGPFEYALPWGHWDVEFERVETKGDMEIEFVGFVAEGIHSSPIFLEYDFTKGVYYSFKGVNPAVLVDTVVSYYCPEGHVFKDDWFREPKVRLV